MNIWSLNKDITIKHLLLLLDEALSEVSYKIINKKNTDHMSVRLTSNFDSDTSVYIYTYGQKQDKYGVHVEYFEQEMNTSADMYDNMSFDSLVELLRTQFTEIAC